MEKEAPVYLSDTAAKRVATLIERQGDPDLKLRVSVNGGGCAGFQYAFGFDAETKDDDTIVEKDGVTLLVDSMSLLFMVGATVDFVEDVIGSTFKIENPNAQNSCSCGTSFSV